LLQELKDGPVAYGPLARKLEPPQLRLLKRMIASEMVEVHDDVRADGHV
jgi:hypothetical protein